jgi:UDP-N-acetylmuramoyl-L-alanyl-D-glutamate--2,6-diaminopimelate ligase
MAEMAEALADKVIVTDDNPRLEKSDDIIRQILFGFSNRAAVLVERDRAAAIRLAVLQASEGDVVLVAGKGHEDYQDVGGQRIAFSDVAEVRLALQARQEAALTELGGQL